MIKVGITGGIGSGKTTVCRFFRTLDIPVFSADEEAKIIMNNSPLVRSRLIRLFGTDIYGSDQKLNRSRLAGLIFGDPELLRQVNELIHPAVRESFIRWTEQQSSPYVVYEAAILFESGFYRLMDYIILVTAPEEERIRRLRDYRGLSREDITRRISQQWRDEQKAVLASCILRNDNKEMLIPKLLELDNKFKSHG
ncbi:MAG: dephospho-CoA kinase [Mangrovibacterium sp.]